MKYTKLPFSVEDQIDLLISRRMEIPDRDRAFHYLSHISYFRLRGYWIPFEMPDDEKNHHFKEGTTFDHVLDLYIFDRKFRLLMLEAIERVEISFRAHFASELSLLSGSHFYLDDKYSHNTKIHQGLIESLQAEMNRSSELFIEYYRKTYGDPPLPPVWASVEVMSFGQLSVWFKNLKARNDRNRVARTDAGPDSGCARYSAGCHGHPSTLHLWWARRPLAAARAVIFAQMVDDPSGYPDLF